jgi:hypothetical protein
MKRIAALLALMTLPCTSGCSIVGPAADPCAGWKPILVHFDDSMTPLTERQILDHNEHGAKSCGW